MLGVALGIVRWLPKITLFYFILTQLGLARYSIFLLVPAFALDAVDYSSIFS